MLLELKMLGYMNLNTLHPPAFMSGTRCTHRNAGQAEIPSKIQPFPKKKVDSYWQNVVLCLVTIHD